MILEQSFEPFQWFKNGCIRKACFYGIYRKLVERFVFFNRGCLDFVAFFVGCFGIRMKRSLCYFCLGLGFRFVKKFKKLINFS